MKLNLSTARLLFKNFTEANQLKSKEKFSTFHQKVITLDKNFLIRETKIQYKFESYELKNFPANNVLKLVSQ